MEGPQETTEIQSFYKNSTVFLTGATGFVGKLFLEKVLRALPVKKVFLLVRSKKDVPATKRFQEIFESPAFDPVKRTNPDVVQKVFLMDGNCSLPMLGLSEEDQKTFIEEVNVIFHVAANVKFDEHIRKATFTNVRATKDLVNLAHQIKKLKSFVYVGTGFSNCRRIEIREEVYPSKITAEKLIAACESLDDECLSKVTETLIGEWPNTYTFTKQVTEDYINREGKRLPICITRPTIVVSTLKEPIAAFVDNVFTLAGFALVNGLGLNRITYCKPIDLDIVPADFVVNESIAAGWQTGESFKPNKEVPTPVYHISSVMDNPISLDRIFDLVEHYGSKTAATKHMVLYKLNFRTTCRYNYLFWRLLLHNFAAYIIDLLLRLRGKKPMFVKSLEKLHHFQDTYEYFTTNSIFLHVDNTHKMLKKMSFQDKQLFNFDISTIDWHNYFTQYCRGLRCYVLKDPLHTLPEGLKHHRKLRNMFIIGVLIVTILLYGTGKFVLFRVVPVIFGLVLNAIRAAVC